MSTATIENGKSLADVLLREKIIDDEQYHEAVSQYERSKRSLLRILYDMNAINEEVGFDILKRSVGCKQVSLENVTPSIEVGQYVTRDVCRRNHLVPLRLEGENVLVAMQDPTDVRAIGDMEKLFDRKVVPVLAVWSEIQETIDRLPTSDDSMELTGSDEESSTLARQAISSLSLLAMVLTPLAICFYFISYTETGQQWFQSFGFTTFESVLVSVIVWGSWASIAYFINDLIFGDGK